VYATPPLPPVQWTVSDFSQAGPAKLPPLKCTPTRLSWLVRCPDGRFYKVTVVARPKAAS